MENKKTLCLETKPIRNFFYELTKGNGNNLEWMFMPPLHQKTEAVEEIKKLTVDNLHKGFLGHYLGYYSKSLRRDMDNPSRLIKYGIEKLLLCSYRVLRTGVILGQAKQVIYNIQEQDRFGFGDCCSDVLSYYLSDQPLSKEQVEMAKMELDLYEDYLTEIKNKSDWVDEFPSIVYDRWLTEYYTDKIKEQLGY